MATADEQGLLESIKRDPDDKTSRLVYADWLDEHGRAYEALLQRVKAGVSEVRFKLRRTTDGLFSNGRPGTGWSANGKEWKQLLALKSHMSTYARGESYGKGTAWKDIEITVVEVRTHTVATLPFSFEEKPKPRRRWTSGLKAVVDAPKPADEA